MSLCLYIEVVNILNFRFANIIVSNPSSKLDKTFTYIVPEELHKKIKLGQRVIVPFGNGNHKIEGFVSGFSENENLKNYKEIYQIIDEIPIFNQYTLNLAKWMSRQYMCTLLECIKCIIPTGISIKSDKSIKLINGNLESIIGKIQKQIIQVLIDNNNEMSYTELEISLQNSSLQSSIKKLSDKGYISIENKLIQGIKEKTIKGVALKISKEEALILLDNLYDKNYAQKSIINMLLDNECVAQIDLIRFTNTSYSVINTMNNKGIIEFIDIKIDRDPYLNNDFTKTNSLRLNCEQDDAYKKIISAIGNSKNQTYLLHGITGSGKTEVYLQSIENVINGGGQAIVLVPEISLTPQMVKSFKSRFENSVAVIHSRLSLGERYDQWKKIRDGEAQVVVGARSAIFAPFSNLKLIIIDEEHESSYKSESKPKYHAKEIAYQRQQIENCVVVLGSATPSIETYFDALQHKIELIEMKNRVNKCILPKVEIVDMRTELEEGNRSIFSSTLLESISNNLEKNEQTILFLNRRGYSTFVSCRSCGDVIKCHNCNIALTYHKSNDTLMCHYCGLQRRNPSQCPSCSSKYIKYFGIGTQRIEQEIKNLFPKASTIRMDMDTTSTKFSHQDILQKFEIENINILIGTQMIAKGLDFPNVTLVGVVSADTSLNIDDFRAQERTFQLLTQVAGRAGRGHKEGSVVIQTYDPLNYSIVYAKNHDFFSFYENEIITRKTLSYPPFVDLISVIISDSDNNYAKNITFEFAKKIKNGFDDNNIKYIILKPTQAPISRIKQKYRWRILIKIQKGANVQEILKKILEEYYDKIAINIDINSNNML